MLRVTSESAVNSSGPQPSPKALKADLPPAPDSFAALIDSTADTASNDRSPTGRDQAPRRPADDRSAEGRPPRDATAPRSASNANAADDPDTKAVQPDPAETRTDSANLPKPAKQDNAETATTDVKATSTSDGIITEQAIAAAVDTLAAAIPAPIAAAISVGVPLTSIPATVAVVVQAPLAIAAAAISSSLTSEDWQEAPAPSPNPITSATPSANPTSAPTASGAATATLGPPANPADKAAGASNAAPGNAAVADAASVTQPAVPNITITAKIEHQAGTVAPAAIAPIVVRTGFNATMATRPLAGDAANPTGSGSAADVSATPPVRGANKTADPQRPIADGKSDAGSIAVAAQPDTTSAANTPAMQSSTSPHQHVGQVIPDHAQADFSASGQAANNLQQLQGQSSVIPGGQLTVTAATTTLVPLNALALQIAVTAQSGKSRFEIRLDPAELGRIDVRIDIDRQGQVTSHLTVEKPETLAMLRQDAPHLQRALDDAGFKTGNNGLQFSLRDQSSSRQNNGDDSNRHAQRLIMSDDETLLATAAGRTYGRMLASGRGVDIRV